MTLHPLIRDEVLVNHIYVNEKLLTGEAKMIVVQAMRTFPEQDDLYRLGRTVVNPVGKSKAKPMGNIVTKAKGGQSYHNYGLAIDYALMLNGKTVSWDAAKDFDGDKIADWTEVASLYIQKGYQWGKSFNDLPHIQKTFNHSYSTLLRKYIKKDFITGTNFVNIPI